MYFQTKFLDRQMTAISVPPPADESLSEGFRELSRIHFYLGYSPIDFMIEAVEKASLEEINKGKLQLTFATKEIQEFLSGSRSVSLSLLGEEKDKESLYFDKSFQDILSHTVEILEQAYKSPTKKNNVEMIETMIGLTQEIIFLQEQFKEQSFIFDDTSELIDTIKLKYQKLLEVQPHYDNLQSLKPFDDYKEQAVQSVKEQLKKPFEFNYAELAKIYYPYQDSWVANVHYSMEELKKSKEPGFVLNEKDTQELKNLFLTQVKSFNRLLNNGIINFVHSYSAYLSKEAYSYVEKSRVSAQAYFDKEIRYHQEQIKNNYYFSDKPYHQDKINKLLAIKDEFIQRKVDDKTFYDEILTTIHRQSNSIRLTLDKLSNKLFDKNAKESITFEGDITTGFVIGKFSNSDKVMLIHKDHFVDVPEAVYAMILDKSDYEKLVKNDTLIFNEELRESNFSKASNFWSYGQFLQEISSSNIQEFFLGQEFDLIDKTNNDKTSKLKMKR